MDDTTPANSPPPAPGAPPPSPVPAQPADRALDAAQQAVDSLKGEAQSSASAAAGGDDAAAAALKAAQAAIAQARELNADPQGASPSAPGRASGATPFELPKVAPVSGTQKAEGIDLLADVNLNVRIELGRTRMLVEDVLRLGEGSVVELDKLAGDPVDVYVNDRHVAKGEVLVLNDNFCVRINEIVEQVAEAR